MNKDLRIITDEIIIKVTDLLLKNHGKQISYIWLLGIELGISIAHLLNMKIHEMDGMFLSSDARRILEDIKREYPNNIYAFQSMGQSMSNKPPKPLSRQTANFAFKCVSDLLDVSITTRTMVYIALLRKIKQSSPENLALACMRNSAVVKDIFLIRD